MELPAATGGDGTLSYTLTPTPPAGLSFAAATRELNGTPSTSQVSTEYTYTVTDSDPTDPDADTLTFMIKVASANLSAAPGNEQVTRSWDDASGDTGIAGWQVRQCSDGGTNWGDWATIDGSSNTTTSHPVTGLANGTEYTFRVKAYTESGGLRHSGEHAEATATPSVLITATWASGGGVITAGSKAFYHTVSFTLDGSSVEVQGIETEDLEVENDEADHVPSSSGSSSVVSFTATEWGQVRYRIKAGTVASSDGLLNAASD